MTKTKFFRRALKRLQILGVFCIAFFLVLGSASDELLAQKKKKNKQDEDQVDPAEAKKKYMFELAKNWSFGYENYKNKQFDRAKKYLWVVAQIDTIDKFPSVYRYLGDSYFKLNNVDSAQVVFEIGAKKHPEDAHLHRMIGFIKAQREQVDESIASYQRVIELEPDSKDDWQQLAVLYVKAGQIDEAIAAYDKILELDPDDADAQANRTSLLGSVGDIAGMIEGKEVTRMQDPQNSRVRFELGELYFREGNYEKAIELFQEFLSLSPNDVSAMDFIANSYTNLENHGKAIEQYKQILDVQPDNKRVMALISRSYKDIRQFSSARAYARRALNVDNKFGLGWIALGEAYEASAEKCVDKKDGKVDFNDKLMYEKAAEQYRRAMSDLQYRQDAERHLSFLQGVVPTKEDKFMHKGETEPTGECYNWIN